MQTLPANPPISAAPHGTTPAGAGAKVEALHEIGRRLAEEDSLETVLAKIVELINAFIRCDSCFVYVLDDDHLILRASKNPHPGSVNHIKLKIGEGITGWVAEHRTPVAVSNEASKDSRFQTFSELPEDKFEAFLSVPILSRGRLVGIINVQHQSPHEHSAQEIQWLSTIGFLVGSEVELARMESEISLLSDRLETRKVVERAKGLLQRQLGIDEETAYLTLQKQCRQRRLSMKKVAEAIVLADDIKRTQNHPTRH